MVLRYLVGFLLLLAAKKGFASPCFGPDADLGVTTIPNCKTEFTDANGERVEVYYNQFGLRDRDYAEKPESGTFRVLVMGRYLAGRGLRDEQIPARRLEEHLRKLGMKQVEVINGANAFYQAPRAAVWFRRFAKAYSPHVIVYFQTAPDFVNDFIEWSYMEVNQLNFPVKYEAEKYQTYFTETVKRLTPTNSPFFSRLSSTLIRLDILWSFYWGKRLSNEPTKPLIEPTARSFKAIVARAGMETDFIVSWVPVRVRVADVLADPAIGVAGLKYFSPRIEASAPAIRWYLTTQNGFRVSSAQGLIVTPENKNLFNANARVLSAEGAEVWAAEMASILFGWYGHRFPTEEKIRTVKKTEESDDSGEKKRPVRRKRRRKDFRIRNRGAQLVVFPEVACAAPAASTSVLGAG